MITLFQKWQNKRQFSNLVHSLDDHLLNDVGLSRDFVYQKLKTPFWKF